MNPEDFIHPLSALETVMTNEGEKEVMNSWAFASMIWSAVLSNANLTAINIAQELFSDSDKFLKLYFRSKCGDNVQETAAVREAIAILAIAVDEKIAEAFK